MSRLSSLTFLPENGRVQKINSLMPDGYDFLNRESREKIHKGKISP
jgi:hypothetical protein